MGILKTLKQAEAGALQWINEHTHAGLTREQLRGGLQVAVGLWVLMATVSTPKVWTALSLPDAALVPTYGIVTFCVCLQPVLGQCGQPAPQPALGGNGEHCCVGEHTGGSPRRSSSSSEGSEGSHRALLTAPLQAPPPSLW